MLRESVEEENETSEHVKERIERLSTPEGQEELCRTASDWLGRAQNMEQPKLPPLPGPPEIYEVTIRGDGGGVKVKPLSRARRDKWNLPKRKGGVTLKSATAITLQSKPGDVLIASHKELESTTKTALMQTAAKAATKAAQNPPLDVSSTKSAVRH
jgi:hypothetical protein